MVVLDMLLEQGVEVVGLLDPDESKHGKNFLGVPVLGDDDTILKFSPDQIDVVNGIGSVKSLQLHKDIYCRIKGKGFFFRNIIHQSAVVSSHASLGEGVQVMAGAIVCAEVSLGNNVIVNTRASISCESQIGDHVHIAPGAIVSGGVFVGEETHIGTGSIILQNLHVGRKALLGAGAVAVRDLKENCVYVGIPAREASRLHET